MFDVGDRNRNSAVLSFEYRPSDNLHFFLDSMYGKKENDLERVDMMWGVRRTSQGGLIIPQNMEVDRDELHERLRGHERHVSSIRSSCSNTGRTSRTRVLGNESRHGMADRRQVETRRAGQLHA